MSQVISGNAPAFSAYGNSNQTIANGTATKIQFQVEEFDTNSNFDNTTNYRFTPTVAGYYQVNAGILFFVNAVNGTYFTMLYKNGSEFKRGVTLGGSNAQNPLPTAAALIYLNGSTDYVEVYGFQTSGSSQATLGQQPYVYFQGSLVRGA